uniref:Uncharacterized protein n=1 Tax=Pectinophora gossypiella TaxID=13191 RepID=A0A1E1W520_PECGO
MLCPEVSNFPPPKVVSSYQKFDNLENVVETFKMNNFYKSLIVTCPDELQIPSLIEECVSEDCDYYKVSNCSLAEFVEPVFIEKFIKNGKLYCLSADRKCIVQNCAAVTPEGLLTIHILENIFQTIGLEGSKCSHNFYEVTIDLKNIKNLDKLKQSLEKLETFDFYINWEPNNEKICPSSVARYFFERNISVSVHLLENKKVTPDIEEIPAVKDTDPEEMAEWVGMLAHQADLSPKETYISTYSQPESDCAMKTSRICLLITKGFITPTIVANVCRNVQSYVTSRELENYWMSVSVQSEENSLWQWCRSSPRMFQAHDSSTNVFFTEDSLTVYSIGQLKYS